MQPEQPSRRPRRQFLTVGQGIGIALLLLGMIAWVVVIMLGFQLQRGIQENLRLIIELAESAGAS
jgi:hypothetical protein